MIKSMTGFASLTREEQSATIAVTVKSVNHRYLDLQLRLPSNMTAQESRVRTIVQRRLTRGRVELMVNVQSRRQPEIEIDLNESFVTAVATALDQARNAGLIQGTLTAGDLLRFPQALVIRERVPPVSGDNGAAGELWEAVERALEVAIDELDGMRTREGDHLKADLGTRRELIGTLLDRIVGAAEEGRVAFEARLTRRIGELALEVPVDPATIAQEIVRAAARADISEEVVRLRGHLLHWEQLADSAEPCGRKLDFLLQEMHREVNTMGAKAEGPGVSELIVAAKAELEKMREQAQNIE